jgi:hypothetical protein
METLLEYIPYLEKNEAALFIGAGVSSIAGCSGLQEICKKLKEIKIVEQKLMNQKTADVPPQEVVAFCKNIAKEKNAMHDFEGVMREGITPDPNKYSKDYLPFIKKVKKMISSSPILTTNVDACLTNTKEFPMNKIFHKLDDMSKDNFDSGGIFHLHGYIENTNDQLWDVYDYPTRYESKIFKEFLCHVLQNYSLLFLGYAFGDKELLTQFAKAKNSSSKPHFALMPDDDCTPHINEKIYYEIYKIKIIKYGPKDQFVNILARWIIENFEKTEIGSDPSRI